MLRIKSGTAVIIRLEAGKRNYFCTEQRQVGSSRLCSAQCVRAGDAQSINPHVSNAHIQPPLYFPPMPFFLFVFKSSPKLLSIFPLLTLLSVLTGKYNKLSISKDLMLKITLGNWLKGLKHAFPFVS